MSFNGKARSAFKKLGAVALMVATMFFVACNQTSGGGGGKPTPASEYAVTFSVEGENGTLKARIVNGEEIASGTKVKQGKIVTFTATPNSGYRVKGWTLDGATIAEAGKNEKYQLTVTKAATVSVSFELVPMGKAVLTLDPSKKDIKVKAVTADGSAVQVEGCNEATLASNTETILNATGETVTLTGKITELECYENQLTALNVKDCTSLQRLNCFSNQLPELEVQGLIALKTLQCNNNQLPELDVRGLSSLIEIYCSGNQLTELVVQGLATLQELACKSNKLTELNLQGLTSLRVLNCSSNQLRSLNVQGLTTLQELSCNGNKLTELNVQGLTSLQIFDCSNNQLSALNVQGLTSLEELFCDGNQLSTLKLQSLTVLRQLYCQGNRIKAEAMTKLLESLPAREAGDEGEAHLYTEKTDIVEGNCKDFTISESLKTAFREAKGRNWKQQKQEAGGNWVGIALIYTINFNVEGGNGLLEATVDGQNISSGELVEDGRTVTFKAKADAGYRVKGWTLDGNPIAEAGKNTEFKLTITKAATVSVSFEEIPPGTVTLTLDPTNLTIKVVAETKDGSAVQVEGCTEQMLVNNVKTELHANGTSVILKGKIKSLNCQRNKLTAVNVQDCGYLEWFACDNNNLTALNVKDCASLQVLNCDSNGLTELGVQGLTALQSLNCSSNKLPELNMQGCGSLQSIICSGNLLRSLNVQDLSALQSLDCSNNQLTVLNVQDLTSLRKLNCSNNTLREFVLQGCTALKELVCFASNLTSLNIQGLTELRKLTCWGNKLNAQAMTEILKALPAREASDDANAMLFTEQTGATEGNCKDYTQSEDLKKAVEDAKSRKWKLTKVDAGGNLIEI